MLDTNGAPGVEAVEIRRIEESGNGFHVSDAADPAGTVGVGARECGAESVGIGDSGRAAVHRGPGRG